MKRTSLLLGLGLILIFSLSSCFKKVRRDQELSVEAMTKLASTKTLFLLRDADNDEKEKWEEAIRSVWKFNAIDVVSREDLIDYPPGNYSLFTIGGHVTTVTSKSGMVTEHGHIYLELTNQYYGDDKTQQNANNYKYWRTWLSPEFGTLMETVNNIKTNKSVDNLYEGGELRNWSPGMIKLYLMDAQRAMSEQTWESPYKEIKNKEKLAKLKSETLYVPERVLIKFKAFTGNEEGRHDAEKLFKGYPYDYKVVSDDELSDMILDGRARYVFDFVKSSSSIYYRIFDTEYGKIFQDVENAKYNFKSKYVKNFVVK